jgi:hypothetical protein
MKPHVLVILLLALSGTVNADVEKIAQPSESGMRLMWWPKVDPPSGWHFDKNASYHYATKAFAPDGSTFSDATTVMYAKAEYKPRVSDVNNLKALIDEDISEFSDATARHEKPLLSRDGKQFQVVEFSPKANGNWERVAYGEEPDYYILFSVSSRNKEGLVRALPAFRSLVASYKNGP